MATIQEIMSSELVTVSPKTPLNEAIQLLMTHRISGLPVVNESNELVGMITEKDLLYIFADNDANFNFVEDLMETNLRSQQLSDSLAEVCDCLLANSFRRVPILDGKRLVGLISRADLMPAILDLAQQRTKA